MDPARDQVRVARRFVVSLAPGPIAGDAALVTSELVSNAVEHARTPVRIAVDSNAGHLRVEVSDSSSILPAVGDLLDDSDHGRGLHLVERLTSAWGVEANDEGKTVRFEMRK